MMPRRRNLGSSIQIPAGGSPNPLTSLVDWTADDRVPRWVTITLASRAKANSFPFEDAIRGDLQWGTDGSNETAEIDIQCGTTVTVFASFVRLSVRADPEDALAAFNNAGDILAIVGFGGHPGNRLPQRTLLLPTITPGSTSAGRRVPAFADSLLVMRDALNNVLTVRMLDLNSVQRYSVIIGANSFPALIPIGNSIRLITVSSDAASVQSTGQVSLIFGLSL